MIYILVTTCLLTLSIVPPAYLQYASFGPFISLRQRRLMYAGYAVCFVGETLVLLYLFLSGYWSHCLVMFKRLYIVLWIPYFLWAVYIIYNGPLFKTTF